MKREPARSGDEVDVIGKHRKRHPRNHRPGVCDSAKRAIRRRERRRPIETD